MEEASSEVTKSPTVEYAELLRDFSAIEGSVYSSDIAPRDKALRSLALPAMIGVGLNAYAKGGPLGYLAIVLTIALLAWLISRPYGHQSKTKKIQTEPRVSARNRAPFAGPEGTKREFDSDGSIPKIPSTVQSLPEPDASRKVSDISTS